MHLNSRCPQCEYYAREFPRLEVCRRCGTARTVADVASDREQDYHNKSDADRIRRTAYFDQMYRKMLRRLSAGTLLDIGCADGLLLDYMERKGWKGQGIDSYDGLRTVPGRIFRAGLSEFNPAARYDLVTMVHSFEHMPDPAHCLEKVRSLLAPGGALLVVVPNYGGLWSRISGADWFLLNTEHHYFHYTVPGLIRVLEGHGFTPAAVRTNSSFAPSPLQLRLAEKRVYETGLASRQPLRSLLFRTANLLRPLGNAMVDRRGEGAEIQILARATGDGDAAHGFA